MELINNNNNLPSTSWKISPTCSTSLDSHDNNNYHYHQKYFLINQRLIRVYFELIFNVPRLFIIFLFLLFGNNFTVLAYLDHVPPPPRNVLVTQMNSSTVKVTWEPPDVDQSEVFGYNVYKFQIVNEAFVNNHRRAIAIVDRNKLYAHLNDLEPNTEYAIRVAAFNMKGDGELSQLTKQSRILTGGKPPSPPRPQSISLVSEIKPIKARVEWLPPTFTYKLPLKNYILWWKSTQMDSYHRAQVQPNELSFILNNLNNGQEYQLHIAAVNEVGASENATEQLITPTGIPDGEPLNIRYKIFRNKL
jgi:hypothetical protein